MDIYRFFHPHHNPRLYSTPVRQQELSELLQVAVELLKAIERSKMRVKRKPIQNLNHEEFEASIEALQDVQASLQTLIDLHPGDSRDALADLISERAQMTGWDNWTRLLGEQIQIWDEDPALNKPKRLKKVANR